MWSALPVNSFGVHRRLQDSTSARARDRNNCFIFCSTSAATDLLQEIPGGLDRSFVRFPSISASHEPPVRLRVRPIPHVIRQVPHGTRSMKLWIQRPNRVSSNATDRPAERTFVVPSRGVFLRLCQVRDSASRPAFLATPRHQPWR